MSTPSASEPVSPSPIDEPGPSTSTGTVTIRGDVVAGVEPGCVLLKVAGDREYLLIGGDRSLITAGGRLEVTGAPDPGLMTTCQQGVPFVVKQVRKI